MLPPHDPQPPVSSPAGATGPNPAAGGVSRQSPSPTPLPRSQRIALLALGYACLGLAAAGAVLPLLPTTIFLIIAAWAFGRASPAVRERLLNHPQFGPGLRHWQEHGTVSRRAKRAAAIAMAASWVLATLISRSLLVSAISGACLAAVAAWLLTRPSDVPPTGGPS